jgi:hypothetical protein
VKAKANP